MGVEGVESVGHRREHLHLSETTCGKNIMLMNTSGMDLICCIPESSHRTTHQAMTYKFIQCSDSTDLLARERLGSSSRIRRSWESRKRRKLMPSAREGKVKKRGGIRTVTCGSSLPKPSSYRVSSASSEHICRTSDMLICACKTKEGYSCLEP